jgi:hypothetical protein
MNLSEWKSIVWHQFGASIEMMENAIAACPDELWGDRTQRPEFWYLAFHALFFLDCYLSESEKSFVPPAPFTLDELDPAGILPERPYTKDELQKYLDHGRRKCRKVIEELTEQRGAERCDFDWLDLTVTELLLYNMRHVQHHAAQLQLLLRQKTDSAPRWVRRATR